LSNFVHFAHLGQQITKLFKLINSFSNYYIPSFLRADKSGDVNFGIHYFNISREKAFSTKSFFNASQIPYYLGVSGFHLTQPKDRFFDEGSKYPMKLVFHGSFIGRIAEKVYAEPVLYFARQSNHNDIVTGSSFYYLLKEKNGYIFLAPHVRFGDAWTFTTGIKFDKFILGMSYDVNAYSLKSINTRKNAFEISISYVTDKETGLQFMPRW
jgi:hypothetical protein